MPIHQNQALADRRKELGLTLEEVAKSVGVSKATVSRWESGEIDNMRRDRIAALAKVLRVSPLFIMGIEEEQPASNTYSPTITPQDEREIEHDLEDMINSMASAAYESGNDEQEDIEALKATLRAAMIQAKRIAKKKYTPRKYRKE